MANKENIDYLLIDIRELEQTVAGIRDAEFYPATFFSQTFQLAHKILNNLHSVEKQQIEALRRQMEEHQRLLESLPTLPTVEPSRPIEPELELEPEVESKPEPIEEPIEESVLIPEPIVKEIPQKPLPIEKPGVPFYEILEKKNLSDFRKAFSLNDRFRFRRELFGGDEGRMNKAILDLNEIHTYEESITYLHAELKWNIEDPSVADFISLLEKRFS